MVSPGKTSRDKIGINQFASKAVFRPCERSKLERGISARFVASNFVVAVDWTRRLIE